MKSAAMADSSPYQRIEQRMRDTKQQRVDEDTAIANFIQRQVLEIGSQKAAKLAEHTKKADEQEWELTNEEQASTDALLAKHLKDAEELFARHKAELDARNRASQQTLWVLAETNKAAKKKLEQEFEKEEALVRAGLKYKKEELNRARAVEDAKDREEVYNFLTAQANSPLPAAQTGQQTARPSSPLGNGFESSISPFDIQPSTVSTSNASSPSHIANSGPATPLPSSPLRSIEIGDAVSTPSTRSALIVAPDRSSAPSPEPTPESAKLNMSTTAVMTRITSTMMSPSPRRYDMPRREAVSVNIESPIILDRRASGSKHLMDDQPAGDRRSPAARVASPATPRVQTTPITKPSVSRLLDFSQYQTPIRTAPSNPSPERVNPRLAMQLYQVRYDLIDGKRTFFLQHHAPPC